jgi:hypothetical protein
MNYLIMPFILLSGIGLFLSLLVHLCSLLGLQIPFHEYAWNLHFGIFIVWIPTVIVAQKLSKDVPRKDFWRAALRGCPTWMKGMTYLFFGYAFINFAVFIFSKKTGSGNDLGASSVEFRGFSGHWMAFYSAALSVLFSSTKIDWSARDKRCRNGHVVSTYAKFCDECGAPIMESKRPGFFGT